MSHEAVGPHTPEFESMPDLDQLAVHIFGDEFPDSTIIARDPDTSESLRLYFCGFAQADVIGGEHDGAVLTFTHADTVFTQTLTNIKNLEDCQMLAEDSHLKAFCDLEVSDNRFMNNWGQYTPKAI